MASQHPGSEEPLDRPRDQVIGKPATVRRQATTMLAGVAVGVVVGLIAGWVLAGRVADGNELVWWVVFLGAAAVCAALGALVGSYVSIGPRDPHGAGTDRS